MDELQPLPSLHRDLTADRETPFRIVWVGDATLAERFVARRAPHITITACDGNAASNHLRAGADPREPGVQLIVIDATSPGVWPMQIIDLAESEKLDVPFVLLVGNGQEELAHRAAQVAVCDVILKTPDFVHQLPFAFSQARARHDLTVAFRGCRQREERVRTILEFQPSVACAVDATGRVLAINRAGQSLLRASSEQVVGRLLREFVSDDDRDVLAPLFAERRDGDVVAVEHRLHCADGGVLPVRTTALPVARPDGPVFLLTFDERSMEHSSVAPEEVAALTGERDRLAQELEMALAAGEADRSAHRDVESQLAEVRTELATTMARLDEERQKFEAELERLRATQATDQRTADEARAAQADYAATVQHVQSECARLMTELDDSRSQWQQADVQRTALAAECDDLRLQLQHMQAEVANHVATAAPQAGNGSGDTSQSSKTPVVDDGWIVQRDALTEALNHAEQARQSAALAFEHEQHRLEAALKAAEATIAAHEAEAALVREADHAGMIRMLNRELSMEAERAEQFRAELAEARLTVSETVMHNARLQGELQNAEAKIAQMSQQIDLLIDDDQKNLQQLREDLVTYLRDADMRCQAIAAERAASRAAWRWRGAKGTAASGTSVEPSMAAVTHESR